MPEDDSKPPWVESLFVDNAVTAPADSPPPSVDDIDGTKTGADDPAEESQVDNEPLNPLVGYFLGCIIGAAAAVFMAMVLFDLPFFVKGWVKPSTAKLAVIGLLVGAGATFVLRGYRKSDASERLIDFLNHLTAFIAGLVAAVLGIAKYEQLVVNDRWWRDAIIAALWFVVVGLIVLRYAQSRSKNRLMPYHHDVVVVDARNFLRPRFFGIPALEELSKAIGQWRLKRFLPQMTSDETVVKFFDRLPKWFLWLPLGLPLCLTLLCLWGYNRFPYAKRLYRLIQAHGTTGWVFFGIVVGLIVIWMLTSGAYIAIKREPVRQLKLLRERIQAVKIAYYAATIVGLILALLVWWQLKWPWARWIHDHVLHDQQKLLIIPLLPLILWCWLIWKSYADSFLMHTNKNLKGGSKFSFLEENSVSQVPNEALGNLKIRKGTTAWILDYDRIGRDTSAQGEEEWEDIPVTHSAALRESLAEAA